MKIVSLNAWGGAVWPALSNWIAELRPDVLCLQEMIRAPEPSPDWLVYADPHRRLDQRANLFRDVSSLLPGHQAWFSPAARGPLTDADGRAYLSEHGLGSWVSPHLAITEQSSLFIHGTFRPDGWGEEPVPRTMQMMRLATGRTGRTMVVAHWHGLRDPIGKADTPARMAQAEIVSAALESFRRDAEPAVLAGDFNLLPQSATFSKLDRLGLRDLVTGFGIADTRTELYAKSQRHANYMLVSEAVEVLSFDAPATPVLSDHRPLILKTRL